MTHEAIITPLNILDRFPWVEAEDLEFKSAKGGIPGNLWETYSAMANSLGGVILLGVQDNGTVIGITDTNKFKKQIWDLLNNCQKVNVNLVQSSDIQVVPHPNGNILAIRIRRADRREKPVYIGQNPLTGTYRRNHEGDYRCTDQEVCRMLADNTEESADNNVLENFSLNDLDLPSLHQYRNRLASRQPAHPWLDKDDLGFLKKLNGWRSCRKSNVEGLTVAGLLMFGRDETIREGLPQYHLDYRERLSLDPEIRWTDRLTLDGTWPGNLYQFYHRVIQRLSADLKLPFELNTDMIRKGESVVHVAIREALVNALIHADYKGPGGIVIEKYPDRFEFSNPGSLLISLDQILQGGVSECRNKSLQQIFTLIGAAERAGSGIDKIRTGWQSQHWRLPTVTERMLPDRVLWALPMVSLIPEESLEKLKKRFGSKFSKLDPIEVQVLLTADIEKYVDNARMRQITGLHPAEVTRCLQGLVSRGFLLQSGQARGTSYHLEANHSLHNEGHSLHNDDHSLHNEGHSLHNPSSVGIPEEQRTILEKIALPAINRKRLPPKEMEQLILSLCKDQWLARQQICDLLKRHPEGILTRFLTPMVEHKLLVLRYPDKPNRTDQAYKTNLKKP